MCDVKNVVDSFGLVVPNASSGGEKPHLPALLITRSMKSAKISPGCGEGEPNTARAVAGGDTASVTGGVSPGYVSPKRMRRSSSILRQMRKLLGKKDGAASSSDFGSGSGSGGSGATSSLPSPSSGGRTRRRRPSMLLRIKSSRARRSAKLSEPPNSEAYLAKQAATKSELETRTGVLAVLAAGIDLVAAAEKDLLTTALPLGAAGTSSGNINIDAMADRVWGMAKMLRMSKSSMHQRALSRLLQEFAELRRETDADMAKKQESKAAALSVQQKRKKRRTSLATGYRRYSTVSQAPSSSSMAVVSDATITEAIVHLQDLESAKLLDPALAQRGRVLVSSGSRKAIMAVLKHANDDTGLETYLRYASTDEEDSQRRDLTEAKLDAERIERASLMRHMTKTRNSMKSLLDALDAVPKEKEDIEGGEAEDSETSANINEPSRIITGNKVIEHMCVLESVVKAAVELASAFGLGQTDSGAVCEGASKEAARQDKLASHELIDLTDPSIKSFVRIRPSNHPSPVLRRIDDHRVAYSQPATQTEGKVTVDHVFAENTNQADIFRAVQPLVLCTLSGWNATILAYGQTGSGKTFTIVGGDPEAGLAGILPRALSELFVHTSERAVDGFETLIQVTFLELYRDSLVDLLSKPLTSSGDHMQDGRDAVVDVLEDAQGRPQLVYNKDRGTAANLDDLKGPWKKALSADEAMAFHHRGCQARAVGRTNLNEHSSRSHSIFMVRSTTEGPTGTTHGILTIVDLAGSENVKQSGVEGSGLSEAQSNNRSLAALGNVLSLLASKKKNAAAGHVPYRSNKLTMILRNSLGGDAHALMITSVRKEEELLGQTTVSLGFAERARSIQNAASRHCKDTDTLERAQHRNKLRNDLTLRISALTATGKWHQAVPHQAHLLAMTESDFGPTHLQVAKESLRLGDMYMRMGKLDCAEKALLRTIGVCEIEKDGSSDQKNTFRQCCMAGMHNLALVSDVLGGDHVTRGLTLHEECLRMVNDDALAGIVAEWRPRILKALALHRKAHS